MNQQPNVLFLFTDQQRADTIYAPGKPRRLVTPALDALAQESTVFDNCFTPAPVCVPARFSMYSGLYPAHSGCCNNNYGSAYTGNGFYSKFTGSGYQTCCVGKMHHTLDLYGPMGFQTRYTQEEMSDPADQYTQFITSGAYKNVFDYNGQRSEMYYIPQVSQLPAEVHPTQWIGDRSVDFLRTATHRARSFWSARLSIRIRPSRLRRPGTRCTAPSPTIRTCRGIPRNSPRS